MTYNDFENALKAVMRTFELRSELARVADRYTRTTKDECTFVIPTLADEVIRLLTIMTNDKFEWIYYWVYELDCGRKYRKGCILDENGEVIKLKSIKDLWKLIEESGGNNGGQVG